ELGMDHSGGRGMSMESAYAQVEEAIRNLNKENQNLTAQLKRSEEENGELKRDLGEKEETLVKFQVAVQQLQTAMEEEEVGKQLCIKEIQIEKKKMDFLVGQFGILQSQLEECRRIVDAGVAWQKMGKKGLVDCKRVIAFAQDKISKLEATLVEKQSILEKSMESCINLESENELLVRKLNELLASETQMKETLVEIHLKLDEKQSKEDETNEELSLLRSKHEDTLVSELALKETCSTLREENDALRDKCTALKGSETELKDELSKSFVELKASQTKQDELSRELLHLQSQLQDLLVTESMLKVTTSTLRDENNVLTEKLNVVETSEAQLKEKLAKISAEFMELERKEQDVSDELLLMQSKMQAHIVTESKLQEVFSALSEEKDVLLNNLNVVKASEEQIKTELAHSNGELEELQRKKEQMGAELQLLYFKIEASLTLETTLKGTCSLLQEENSRLVEELGVAQESETQRKEELAKSHVELEELLKNKSALEETCSILREEKDALLNDLNAVKASEAQVKEELTRNFTALEDLQRREIETGEDVRLLHSKLQASLESEAAMQVTISTCLEEKVALTEQLNVVKEELAKNHVELQELQKKESALEETCSALREEKDALLNDLNVVKASQTLVNEELTKSLAVQEELQRKRSALEENCSILLEEKNVLLDDLNGVKASEAQVKEELVKSRIELQELQKKESAMEETCSILREKKDAILNDLNAVKDSEIKVKEELMKSLATLEEMQKRESQECGDLQSKLEVALASESAMKAAFSTCQDENIALMVQLNAVNADLTKRQAELQELQGEKDVLDEELRLLNLKLQSSLTSESTLKHTYSTLHCKNMELLEELKTLKASELQAVEELAKSHAEVQDMKTKEEKLAEELRELQSKRKVSLEYETAMKENFSTCQDENVALVAQLNCFKEGHTKSHLELQELKREKEQLIEELCQLNLKLQASQTSESTWKQTYSTLQSENIDLLEELNALKISELEVKEQLTASHAELQELRAKEEQLAEELRMFQTRSQVPIKSQSVLGKTSSTRERNDTSRDKRKTEDNNRSRFVSAIETDFTEKDDGRNFKKWKPSSPAKNPITKLTPATRKQKLKLHPAIEKTAMTTKKNATKYHATESHESASNAPVRTKLRSMELLDDTLNFSFDSDLMRETVQGRTVVSPPKEAGTDKPKKFNPKEVYTPVARKFFLSRPH
ncbi:unnamed protein product, partial [Allacma fusca]